MFDRPLPSGIRVFKNGIDITGSVTVIGNRLSLSIEDNGEFDEDGAVGVIYDPITLAERDVKSGGGGGVGGCQVSSSKVSGGISNILLIGLSILTILILRRGSKTERKVA